MVFITFKMTMVSFPNQRLFLQTTLLMNQKLTYPVRFPFNPSSIRLNDIQIPAILNLYMLRKV